MREAIAQQERSPTPHFNGDYDILVRMQVIRDRNLCTFIIDWWVCIENHERVKSPSDVEDVGTN